MLRSHPRAFATSAPPPLSTPSYPQGWYSTRADDGSRANHSDRQLCTFNATTPQSKLLSPSEGSLEDLGYLPASALHYLATHYISTFARPGVTGGREKHHPWYCGCVYSGCPCVCTCHDCRCHYCWVLRGSSLPVLTYVFGYYNLGVILNCFCCIPNSQVW